jgi:hypothetical protein
MEEMKKIKIIIVCKLKQPKNPKQEKEITKINLNTLYVQRKFWKPHSRIFFVGLFFV